MITIAMWGPLFANELGQQYETDVRSILTTSTSLKSRTLRNDARHIAKPPKARKAPKANFHCLQKRKVIAIDDEEEDEDMEDEIVTSDNDDELWVPNMKGRKRNKNRKSGQAAGTTTSHVSHSKPGPGRPRHRAKKEVTGFKDQEEGRREIGTTPSKSFFEQTVENAVRSETKVQSVSGRCSSGCSAGTSQALLWVS